MNEIYVSDEYWKENESMHVEDAEFKVDNAISLLRQCEFSPTSILDCGCGSGKHAYLMARECQVLTKGIDVSPGAVAHAQGEYALDNLSYEQISIAEVGENEFDLGLMFDVFEHVDDYIGFLRIAKTKAEYWLFNIPLDMNVISTVLGSYIKFRRQFGHLHYFSDRSALATLAYAGFDVVDSRYVFDAGHSIRARANFRNVIASLPRALLFRVSPSWCSRIFGGPSLMVLARNEST